MVRLGGYAALLGGLAWIVKGGVILAGGDQPPVLFEVAPCLFGLGLWGVAHATMRPGRRRQVVLWLAAGACGLGLVALVSELVGEGGAALAVSSVALLIGLLTLERRGRRPAPLAWWLGAGMLPALAVGGALAEIDERLLEVPLVGLGIAWALVGCQLLLAPIGSSIRPSWTSMSSWSK